MLPRSTRNTPSKSMLLALLSILFSTASSLSTPMGVERPSQYYPAFCDELPSLDGKTVVITGGSRGLGYVTARTVARKGGHAIVLSRASETAADALRRVSENATGPSPTMVECDLRDFQSVKKACGEIQIMTKDTGIDVLCCNAGVMLQPNQATVDGFDVTAQTNMLSHFLMTRQLMPGLEFASKLNGESRVVTMSSMSGFGGPAFNPTFFQKRGGNLGDDPSASYERYHQSKLANLAFCSALHDRLRDAGSEIKSVACHPGVCGTDMFVHATKVMTGRAAPRDRAPSPEDGSLAQLKCIFDPKIESGELWGPARGGGLGKVEIGHPQILVDADTKAAVWRVCEEAVGKFEV